ncbi:hypothetical protein KIN20_034270 [Parelaphostrongylus tenuis]|uniref:Uncharacterized protein n=1 Tax=Parelaphostrongylus tenuis TaxID=148309 RepID=A0AAD5RA36_PARTN|nr:hypothetical protein KIN20_034270 [Parelaphostrongylus tenuis]
MPTGDHADEFSAAKKYQCASARTQLTGIISSHMLNRNPALQVIQVALMLLAGVPYNAFHLISSRTQVQICNTYFLS